MKKWNNRNFFNDLKIPFIYLIISTGWVVFTSKLITEHSADVKSLTIIEIYKGWIFICITGIILYFLIRRERKKIEYSNQKMKEAESKFRCLVEESILGIYIIQNGKFTYVNPTLVQMTGYSEKELMNMQLKDLVVQEETGKAATILPYSTVEELNSAKNELKLKTSDGAVLDVVVLSHKIQIVHNDEPAIMGSILDNTQKRKFQNRLERLAFHDPLTDLANRRLLSHILKETISTAKKEKTSFAFLFIDLDRFKGINDSIGHDIGDKVLQEIAHKLVEYMKEKGTVSRYGGDEFTILIPEIASLEEMERLASGLIQLFNEPLLIEEHEFFVTLSLGIAIFPEHGEDQDTLEKNADIAMYFAKEKGRNNYQIFTNTMKIDIIEKINIQHELRKAMEDINSHFLLYYQPKISLIEQKVIGLEALIRWKHQDLGFVSPAKFIPYAEEIGMILQLSDWVLKEGCNQLKEWNRVGLFPVLCINISPILFQQANFVERIIEKIQYAEIDPSFIQLEITESVMTKHVEDTIIKLEELKKHGITIAIDDFGTGYSSLSILKKLPIDTLKIDQSFIKDFPKDQEIVSAIISMAHSLSMHVMAEGVETIEQSHILQSLGCTEIQGYLFSKPLPVEQVTSYMKEQITSP